MFYLTTGEAESKPEIKQATLVQNAEGKQEVLFDLENTGNAHARLRGEVVIKGDSGEPIVSPIANLVVLHEATRKYKVQIEGDLPANPEVKVTLENIFAPQTSTGIIAMDAFEAPLVLEETALDVQPGPAEDAETTLE